MAASSWMLGGLLVFGLCDLIALDALIAPRALAADEPVANATLVAQARPVPVPVPVPLPENAPDPAPAAAIALAVADPLPVADPIEPAPAPAPAPSPGLHPVVIYFASDRATIRPAAAQQLDDLASQLVAAADVSVVIVGHADERGSEADNDFLSARRMHRVRDYLGTKGIAAGRMTGRAAGEREPVDTGTSEEALAQNRRVEIQLERSSR